MHEEDGKVIIPTNLSAVVKDVKILSEKIYPNLKTICIDKLTMLVIHKLTERAILTPKTMQQQALTILC